MLFREPLKNNAKMDDIDVIILAASTSTNFKQSPMVHCPVLRDPGLINSVNNQISKLQSDPLDENKISNSDSCTKLNVVSDQNVNDNNSFDDCEGLPVRRGSAGHANHNSARRGSGTATANLIDHTNPNNSLFKYLPKTLLPLCYNQTLLSNILFTLYQAGFTTKNQIYVVVKKTECAAITASLKKIKGLPFKIHIIPLDESDSNRDEENHATSHRLTSVDQIYREHDFYRENGRGDGGAGRARGGQFGRNRNSSGLGFIIIIFHVQL